MFSFEVWRHCVPFARAALGLGLDIIIPRGRVLWRGLELVDEVVVTVRKIGAAVLLEHVDIAIRIERFYLFTLIEFSLEYWPEVIGSGLAHGVQAELPNNFLG